jgi:hypothetical protein
VHEEFVKMAFKPAQFVQVWWIHAFHSGKETTFPLFPLS